MSVNYTYGYARVSKQQQELIRQLDMLKKYNCNEIFSEKMSGTKSDRPELIRLKEMVRPGDTIVIESFSRLGRSTKDLIELVEYFEGKGCKLVSIKENFDTNTPQGKLMLTVFQAFSQFERDLIAQRTKEGLESARARGRKGGRPKVNDKNIKKALNLYNSNEFSVSEIVEMTGISQATLYRYIQKMRPPSGCATDSNNEKIAEIKMWVRVENNSKFVRGKKRATQSIENHLRYYYDMQVPDFKIHNCDYVLHLKYTTIEELKNKVYDILQELDNTADMYNCFIEADAQCDELNLTW